MKIVHSCYATCLLLLSLISVPFFGNTNDLADQVTFQEEESEFGPVDDMHKFMEFISKPAYRELKSMLAEEDIRRSTWRKIQQHSLVLAETTILVADRGPEDKAKNADWREISLVTFKEGKALYEAAGEKDRDAALKHYGLMIDACNKCHEKYDENNHQLAK